MNNVYYILDASALLAMLHDEPGAKQTIECIAKGSAISAVNYCEVLGKCVELGISAEQFVQMFKNFHLPVLDFNELLARRAGALKSVASQFGLSLGDRACLALACEYKVPAVTTDRVWKQLGEDFNVFLIR